VWFPAFTECAHALGEVRRGEQLALLASSKFRASLSAGGTVRLNAALVRA